MLGKGATCLVLGLAVAALAGCGTSGVFGGTTTSEAGTTTTGAQAGTTTTAEVKVPKPPKPLEPPKARQSVAAAEAQIAKLSAGGCKSAYKLNPIALRDALDNQARCRQLQSLAGLHADGATSYKGGAVIDYALGIRSMSVVLIRDSDGKLRVAFPDYFVTRSSAGTKLAPGFDRSASKAIKGLRTHDCSLFRAYASQELGPASVGKDEACKFAEENPVADVFSGDPEAEIQQLGGNANFAFYGIGGPASYFTLVFARESSSDYLPKGTTLSRDAPELGFAGIYVTGQRDLTGGGKGKSDSG